MENTPFLDKYFVIAEIGGNHEGDYDYARKLLLDAAESGADAVKFQMYKPDKLVSKVEDEQRNRHFSKFSLTDEQYVGLARLAQEKGIIFMCSVWDLASLELLDSYIPIHKVGSGDLTNYPMLEALAKTGKPLLIATAMATLEEIRQTVDYIDKVNPDVIKKGKLVIMQCVAMYGSPRDEFANLAVLENLKREFPNIVIGYSDHTEGILAAQYAAAMGARVLELHFTDDKSRDFRDHHFSVTREEMKELVGNLGRLASMLGTGKKEPVKEVETDDRISEFRRACYFNRDMKSGDIVGRNNLDTLRPNKGISAVHYYSLIGKRLIRDKKAYEHLEFGDIEL